MKGHRVPFCLFGSKEMTMTAQLSDQLEYMGETMRLTTLPLSAYWTISGSIPLSRNNSRVFRDVEHFGLW